MHSSAFYMKRMVLMWPCEKSKIRYSQFCPRIGLPYTMSSACPNNILLLVHTKRKNVAVKPLHGNFQQLLSKITVGTLPQSTFTTAFLGLISASVSGIPLGYSEGAV